ncbi:MAG: hypothetical protein E3J35_00640 [Methanomassiliicoccales archaeon]|nr:MAG: hypothetical protein E3J35_00640 [Methanomassiliicoccales archaeon]
MQVEIGKLTVRDDVYLDPVIEMQFKIRNDSKGKVHVLGFSGIVKMMDRIVQEIPQRNFVKEMGSGSLVDTQWTF